MLLSVQNNRIKNIGGMIAIHLSPILIRFWFCKWIFCSYATSFPYISSYLLFSSILLSPILLSIKKTCFSRFASATSFLYLPFVFPQSDSVSQTEYGLQVRSEVQLPQRSSAPPDSSYNRFHTYHRSSHAWH